MPSNMSLFAVQAVLVLASDSSRILVRYYTSPHGGTQNPYPTLVEQKAFERGLVEKTSNKLASDVILYDNRVVVFKNEGDVMLCVVGNLDENEVLLYNVVLALRDSLSILLKDVIDKRTLIENYDLACLCIDEMVDDGIILETDAMVIASRVTKPPTQDVASMQGIDLSEEGLLKIYQFGKQKLGERLRQGL
ncbi:snare-like protein [Piedraia hortae CBS 480.64]|uniref:Coatomer subunit zeta n=1 Tax=Piedraia hortae CBS 480.64 TaxID=1314780 RepID=A0A6A7BRM4_9PEZI|nr:snare-like protein [Piedraia hortae CBS 480.64]